jgi:hypothetical protein
MGAAALACAAHDALLLPAAAARRSAAGAFGALAAGWWTVGAAVWDGRYFPEALLLHALYYGGVVFAQRAALRAPFARRAGGGCDDGAGFRWSGPLTAHCAVIATFAAYAAGILLARRAVRARVLAPLVRADAAAYAAAWRRVRDDPVAVRHLDALRRACDSMAAALPPGTPRQRLRPPPPRASWTAIGSAHTFPAASSKATALRKRPAAANRSSAIVSLVEK